MITTQMCFLGKKVMKMQREKNLVILAAGIGSRFRGGIKQLHSVGPAGECIMDYSISDALEAGFNRVVLIIRKDIESLFEELIGARIRRVCARRGVEVVCAYQEKQNLPDGFQCPADRVKPWGTGQALLSCKGLLHGGFVVINADDYYGKDAYQQASQFLDSLDKDALDRYALIGFYLANTLSDHGGVTRGLCRVDEEGFLTHIQETKKILKTPNGPGVEGPEGMCYFDGDTPVSMNMWAFTPDVLGRLERRLIDFLGKGGLEDPRSEFLIPTEIGGMLDSGVRVKVLPTDGQWFGMTFVEDTLMVRQKIQAMTEEGKYPTPLFA